MKWSKPRVPSHLLVLPLMVAMQLSPAQAETLPDPIERGVVEAGHSANWYAPTRDGEGWMLEILDEQRAAITWFTYDEAGAQRWLYGLGTIVDDEEAGQSIVFSELRAPRGGRFGPDFDPGTVQHEVVGSLSLRFEDCASGQLDYSAYGQAERIPIQRLTQTMAAGCAPIHGVTGQPIHPLAGQSGNWFDPARSGEGLQLLWTAQGQATLTWYTYDNAGNPYWLTGLGQREGEGEDARIVFSELYTTRGGRFGEDFDPALVERLPWGRLELAIGCDAGTATFASTLPEFGSGSRDLRLLTRAVPAACPWVKPKLTDLYDIEYVELPTQINDPRPPRAGITVHDIADDGTLVGSASFANDRLGVMFLRPGAEAWEIIGDRLLEGVGGAGFITPDGRTIYVDLYTGRNPRDYPSVTNDKLTILERWREGLGWEEMPGSWYLNGRAMGFSRNRRHSVGYGALWNVRLPSFSWRWSESTGREELPRGVTPMAVSNDGQTIVGSMLVSSKYVATQLKGGGLSQVILSNGGQLLAFAQACDADCNFIFGGGWTFGDASAPESFQPWVKGSNGYFSYLDYPDALQRTGLRTAVRFASGDGSIITGEYPGLPLDSSRNASWDTWVWTQNTGAESLLELVDAAVLENDPELSAWHRTRIPRSMSADGKTILLSDFVRSVESPLLTRHKNVILRLVPKSSKSEAVTSSDGSQP